jgi:sRNA-binding regulator protein Hfq
VVGLNESTTFLHSLRKGVVKMLVFLSNAVKVESVPLNFS